MIKRLWTGTLSENLPDEMCRNTKTLCDCYNNHICYVNNINAVFQSFRWPNRDTFFNRTFNLERNLITYSERVKTLYPRIVYRIRETLFDKLDSLGINYTSEQKLFKNLAILDFESICIQEETFRNTIKTLDRRTCPDISIKFFKPCRRTNFPLQPWSSSPHCIFYWSSWKNSFPKQSENEKLVPWYRSNNKK